MEKKNIQKLDKKWQDFWSKKKLLLRIMKKEKNFIV